MRYLLKQILTGDGNVVENTKNTINSLDKKGKVTSKKITVPKVSKIDPAVTSVLKVINKSKR